MTRRSITRIFTTILSTPEKIRLGSLLKICLVSLLAFSAPLALEARLLHWEAMHVDARLDGEGRLHIVERQTMVMTGDWNGGERIFNVRPGQKLKLNQLTRVDPTSGREIILQKGDLDRVDQFDWAEGRTLRWRSRLPEDPVFDNQVLIYVLDYTLTGVLAQEKDTYVLNHDFAFPDRVGVIKRFTLNLEVDPVWREIDPLPANLERLEIPPGTGVILRADLAYTGSSQPSQVLSRAPLFFRLGALGAMLAGMGWFLVGFLKHEKAQGRFQSEDLPRQLELSWLEEHLFSLKPEEVGALWDGKVGAPEVAAVLARLVAEKKIASEVVEKKVFFWKRQILTLKLLVERKEFLSYERKLIDKFFFDGRQTTDTDAIRKRYQKKGLDPAGLIRKPIERRLKEHRLLRGMAKTAGAAKTSRLPWVLLGVFVLLMILEGILRGETALMILGILMLTIPLILIGSMFIVPYRRASGALPRWMLGFLLPALLLALMATFALLGGDLLPSFVGDFYPGFAGVLAFALWPVVLFGIWVFFAKNDETPERIRKRYLLAEIRQRFIRELQQENPVLDDRWLPYLMAFGLHQHVDRWFKSFGGATSSGVAFVSSSSGSGSSFGGSSPSWTGGGGSFGGAGASATWAAAATGLATGVAAPSSSSSGGGGGSSGGGGGGCW